MRTTDFSKGIYIKEHSPRIITSTKKLLAGKAGNEVGLADETLLDLASIICLNKPLHIDLFSKNQYCEALCGKHVSRAVSWIKFGMSLVRYSPLMNFISGIQSILDHYQITVWVNSRI